ncbi:MAG TPA: aliphatic sulfonate ABC transporter substrate-binding protein [Planctomycetota bacterium]|nr:aliphatic sulfonate ABC transporter substrate-binding protein [Planctomycetota bacterium]
MRLYVPAFTLLLAVLAAGCGTKPSSGSAPTSGGTSESPRVLRLGYFANLTHAQALIGVSRGDFQQALGSVKLETKTFNAGPSVIEALFANQLDIAYIGPSPAVNGFIKSGGEQVRVIGGACANGVAIVVSKDSNITDMKQLAGKRIATPQYANTQDVSARHYVKTKLKEKLKEDGGATDIQPVANADQLNLFKQAQIDAAWSPEPWASRLIHEADAKLLREEKDDWESKRFISALIIVSPEFLKNHPQTVETFLRAHTKVTAYINANREEASEKINAELKNLSGKALKPEVLKDAMTRVEFTTDPLPESVKIFAQWSKELGMLKDVPDLTPLFELSIQKKIDAEAKK